MANLWDGGTPSNRPKSLWDSTPQSVAPTGFNATYQDTGDTLYDVDLVNDVNYQKASKVIYEMNNSVNAPRLESPEDYARYGIETMGWFNWNLPKMSLDAHRISGATDEQKQAFLYMMEAYDDLGVSWNGAKRFFKGVILDPTTYAGLTTFGIGTVAGQGAKQASKQGIKELLKSSTKGGIIAGVESGIYTAVDDVNRQVVETSVSGEDIDLGRVATSAAIGGTAGFVLGTGITAGVRKFTPEDTIQKIAGGEIVEEVAPLDVGVYVKAGDRGNIGKVVSMEGDTVTVNFQNKEKGTEATITFKQDEVKSVTKVKRSTAEGRLIDDLPSTLQTSQLNHEFSGSLDLVHGYSKSSREFENEMGEFISLGPLEKFDPIGEFKGFRFDGDGGTFGDQGVYLEDTSNLFFNTPDMQGFDSSELAHVKASFEKAFVLTPDTLKVFNKLTKKGTGKEVVQHLKAQGYDGIIVKGFDPNKKYRVADEGFTQPQVMHFKPETMEVVSTSATKDRDTFVSGLPKNNDTQPTPLLETPGTPAQKLRTDLEGVIQAIKRTVPAGKAASLRPDGTQDLDDLVKSAEPISILLAASKAKTPQELADFLRNKNLTDAQGEFLEVATSQAVSALKAKVFNLRLKQQALEGEDALSIQTQIDELENVIAPLDELDVALSTLTGQRLRARQKSYNTGELRGTTIKSLMAEGGLSRTDAERQWDAIFAEKLQKQERRQEIEALSEKIEEVRKSGDISEFIKLKEKKKIKQDEFAEEALLEEGSALYRAINKPIKVMNEVMISFVFSPATLIVNTVPSFAKAIYKPFLNNLMQDGLSATSRKKMAAEYSAMASMIPSAAKMARAAWRYEKSMLTGDSARFLEEYNTIPKKYGGGILRHFPRALLATDAFFENIHYRGYAVGNATGNAMEAGVAKGLKGKELDDFVKAEVENAVSKAYAPEENAIDILMSDGISRGLKGKKLENFINKELAKNEETFVKATDQEGRDYVQDILFKRDFSGTGTASQLARGYEGFVNKNPAMRLMGQLFFRTPVRVFEEGIRMTPGLQLVSPKYISDLKGANGSLRQSRAQGEAMMSYAIAGYVFTQYATGNLSGSMGTNYKQTRQSENAGDMEPYSIKFNDGSIFNYRNFDPFSTPVKILVNALERAETLAYRKEQGERVDDDLFAQTHASVSIAVASIFQSIRDANLTSGIDEVLKVMESAEDMDGAEKMFKYFGRKAQTFLPNTWYKMQMLDNPVLADPLTLEQHIRYRINPADPLVPKQYTALGKPRTDANSPAKMYYFSTASVEDRKRGKSEKELEVERFLDKISQAGDTHFTAPYKVDKYYGDRDLRTIPTDDGTESLYDRWMRYYSETPVVDVLYSYIGTPIGTASEPGVAEKAARKVINNYRNLAFNRLYAEDIGVQDRFMELFDRKLKTIPSDNIPHNITGTR